MNRDRLLIVAVDALALVALGVFFNFNCSAHGADVEIAPSTQPITMPDGSVVMPPPTVKIEGGDKWTPQSVYGLLTALIVFCIAAYGLYEVVKLKVENARRKQAQEDSDKRLDRQGATQEKILRDMPSPGEHPK